MAKICPLTHEECTVQCAWLLDDMCSITALAMSEKIGWNNYIIKERGVEHHEVDGD